MNGKIVKRGILSIQEGFQEFSIDVSQLSSGYFIMYLNNNNQEKNIPFIKL